ncbi:unnamed protein product [Durusdinium trenchii]
MEDCCSLLCSNNEGATSSLISVAFMPPNDAQNEVNLGTHIPEKPLPALPETAPKITRPTFSRACCGRPGEPLNKVCLLVSTDLEGFLPYRLIISEERGFDFASLSPAPDFCLEPAHVVKVQRISLDAWQQDRSFGLLCRTVEARSGLKVSLDWSVQDRVRPPYVHLVQILAREKEEKHPGHCSDFIIVVGVQTEALAEELLRSCLLLKKRRALTASRKVESLLGKTWRPSRMGYHEVPYEQHCGECGTIRNPYLAAKRGLMLQGCSLRAIRALKYLKKDQMKDRVVWTDYGRDYGR